MKTTFKEIFIIYILVIISVVINIIISRSNILNNTRILKGMSESTQITDLNKNIEQLNDSHTEYANHIQTSKQKIANAINMYPNNNATAQNTLEEFSTMINSLTNIPENTYYYEKGTEGDSSTIKRYKKIGDSYYVCDENGIVLEGASATDVSSKTLEPYKAAVVGNMSAGSAGYSLGNLLLGDSSDNVAYYDNKIEYIGDIVGTYYSDGIQHHVLSFDDTYKNYRQLIIIVPVGNIVAQNIVFSTCTVVYEHVVSASYGDWSDSGVTWVKMNTHILVVSDLQALQTIDFQYGGTGVPTARVYGIK